MDSNTSIRDQLFISYSHKDDKWLKRLQIFLKPMERKGMVTWDDTKLKTGEQWREEIQEAIESARVAVLLLSADFLDSDFISEAELPRLLAAAKTGGAVILPVILSPCALPESLSEFQAANAPNKTLVDMKRAERDRLWLKVAMDIEAEMKPSDQVTGPTPPTPPSEPAQPISQQPIPRNILTEVQRRLASFVDRAREVNAFCQMIETRQKPVMYVWGATGLGKTSLFYRLVKECEERELRKSILIWTDTRRHDYVDIMCKIKNDLGADTFKPFADEINSLAGAPESNLSSPDAGNHESAPEIQTSGLSMENVPSIKASAIVPMSDMAAIERSRMIRLTDLFIDDLGKVLVSAPLVVLFDGVEKMPADTSTWFREELLQAVSDGRLPNICFLLCAQNKPDFGGIMNQIIEEAELQPLQIEDVVEFLAKRSEAENLGAAVNAVRRAIANIILKNTHGKPNDVATQVDAFITDCKRDAAR